MHLFAIPLQKQCDYVAHLFNQRQSDRFTQSMLNNLFPDEPSALSLFMHGIESLFQTCQQLAPADLKGDAPSFNIATIRKNPTGKSLTHLYQVVIQYFDRILTSKTVEDLQTLIISPISNTSMPYQEWIGINLHHTIGHVAQSLRLQAIYLRHN